MLYKIKTLLLPIFAIIILITSNAYAKDDDEDDGDSSSEEISELQSIKANLMNPVFKINLSNGAIMDINGKDVKNRVKVNNSVLTGKDKVSYSLYDRFGGDIKFVPYFGESKISTSLLDKFYTYFLKNRQDFEVSGEQIKKLITEPKATSNNTMYVGRPDVLSQDDVRQSGKADPRVEAWSGSNNAGIDASIGNLNMGIAKWITQITAWLTGADLFNMVDKIWKSAWDTQLGKIFTSFLKYIFPIIGIIVIFTIVSKTFGYYKGNTSPRDIFRYISVGVILAGIITSFSSDPNKFLEISRKVVNAADDAFDESLSFNGSPVVKSDSKKNVRMASLWEETVFKPWVDGTFGVDYNDLYGHGAKLKKGQSHNGLGMTNQSLTGKWGTNIKHNTPMSVGEPRVLLGNKKTEDNWAALAWSTQSLYHISPYSVKGLSEVEGLDEKGNFKGAWPISPTTPNNQQIYLDNFRWIDAKLNISYGYAGEFKEENKVQNYPHGKKYKETFVKSGFEALFLSLLLAPIFVMGLKKIRQAILVVTNGVGFLVNSVRWYFSPNDKSFSIGTNFKRVAGSLGWYIWISLIIFIQIITYKKFIHAGGLGILAWIVIGTYLCTLKPPKSPMEVRDKIKNNIDRVRSSKQYNVAVEGFRENRLVTRLSKQEVKDSHKNTRKDFKEPARHMDNEDRNKALAKLKSEGKMPNASERREEAKRLREQYFNSKDKKE